MRGGAQAQLMRCDDGHYYVVKFQNNPQHPRILVNELLGTRMAAQLGIPTPPAEVIHVSEELIRYSEELAIEVGRTRTPCQPGPQFGSRYPGQPERVVVHDFLPDKELDELENLHDFAGALVFDKWICNTNGRQSIFHRPREQARYRAAFLDQGFACNAGEWTFPDAPLRGIYMRQRVYAGVRGMESFAPWLHRLETHITAALCDQVLTEIPPEWYGFEQGPLLGLLEKLMRRRKLVPELILAAKNSSRQPFPNWS